MPLSWSIGLTGESPRNVINVILHGILTGILPSGKRLKEIPLSTALRVGRTPVREAPQDGGFQHGFRSQ